MHSWSTGLHDLDEYLRVACDLAASTSSEHARAWARRRLPTIGLHMAAERSVGMMSMEMPHRELRDRMTDMLGRVSLSSVIRPNRGDGINWTRVMDGVQPAKSLRFRVSDQGGLNINQVRTKARALKRTKSLDVLIVDYIGLMNGLDSEAAARLSARRKSAEA